jgi:N-acetylglucosaminyl-diphospho-decaprenol L-rhamnosyltransferase
MKATGAVIVTYNSEAEIGACLDSVLPRAGQVVVVDNASSDGTLNEVRRRLGVMLIANADNRGFAAGVNQGIGALDSRFVLLLNPDARLLTGAEPLVEACDEAQVGAAAGRLVDGLDRPQAGFSVRRFPTPLSLSFEVLGLNRIWRRNPVNRRYRCLDLDLEAGAEVEQPAGAFLMIRRDAWQAVGGFDEGFRPVWFEDVDFLKRLRDGGYVVRYVPSAVARHRGGHSVERLDRESREVYWYASLLRYSSKHFGARGRAGVCLAVVAGCLARMLYGIFSEWSLRPAPVYGRVIRFACRRLLSGRNGEAGRMPALARQ